MILAANVKRESHGGGGPLLGPTRSSPLHGRSPLAGTVTAIASRQAYTNRGHSRNGACDEGR